MNPQTFDRLRTTVRGLLEARGQNSAVGDGDSLFISGRLDSHAATEVIMLLESDFGVDFSDADFDITALDTISSMADLIRKAA
jgi:acyl carrier protein